MNLADLIITAHLVATLAMVGVIWFVQVVHYPLMGVVPADSFIRYEDAHQRRTTLIVGPLMLVEALSALALAWLMPAEGRGLALVGVALLGGVWASTFLVQVPLHARLGRGFEAIVHRRLVRSNWIRTGLWTVRGGISVALSMG